MVTEIRKLHYDTKRQDRRRARAAAQTRSRYVHSTDLKQRVLNAALRMGGYQRTRDEAGRDLCLLNGHNLKTLYDNTDWAAYPPDTHERAVIVDWLKPGAE